MAAVPIRALYRRRRRGRKRHRRVVFCSLLAKRSTAAQSEKERPNMNKRKKYGKFISTPCEHSKAALQWHWLHWSAPQIRVTLGKKLFSRRTVPPTESSRRPKFAFQCNENFELLRRLVARRPADDTLFLENRSYLSCSWFLSSS